MSYELVCIFKLTMDSVPKTDEPKETCYICHSADHVPKDCSVKCQCGMLVHYQDPHACPEMRGNIFLV